MRNLKVFLMITLLFFSIISTDLIRSAKANQATVASDFLNVRSGPGLSYDIIDRLDRDQSLEVLSSSEEWLEVQYNDQTGWVASWLVSHAKESTPTENIEVIATTDGLNFRANASIDAPILTRLNAGDRAVLLDRQNEWLHVQFNGTKGWVYAQYTSEVTETKEESDTSTEEISAPEKSQSTPPTAIKPETFTVAVNALNVRIDANQSSKKVATVYKNETYSVLKTAGNWVHIKINDQKEGWVYSFHGNLNRAQRTTSNNNANPSTQQVTILTDGTNIREAASTSSTIATRANAGDQFTIVKEHGDWYEVEIANNTTAFVANWVVSINDGTTVKKKSNQQRVPGTLKGLTIVVDPGHGGDDKGTTGARGTFEKTVTLKTAELLASKLKAAGAMVHLTRETDRYLTLQDRVSISIEKDADAFISLHYDANLDSSITGFTTYYQHSNQAALAKSINHSLDRTISLKNRGAQPADYYVLRENQENAVLIELGFLSNPAEEMSINTNSFREQATYGIYTGILNHFN